MTSLKETIKGMKFVCEVHGEVEPEGILYSCPTGAYCPECGDLLSDESEGAGIRVIDPMSKEAFLIRPEYYKKNHPEMYERYKSEIEEEQE